MTIEITNNPHSFIVFLTLSMGISYSLFARPGLGFGKILAIVMVVIPMGLMAYERHHIVDIGLGFIIGFLFAKGIIDTSRPLAWFIEPFQNFRWRMKQAKREREDAREQAEANQSYQDSREQEAKRRQEQARQEREWAKQEKSQDNNQKSSNHSGSSSQSNYQQSSGSNKGYEEFKQHYQQPPPKQKTELEKAFEVLGVPPTATYEEAKKAYRKLVREFHPDAQAGASESVKKMGEEKMKKINIAWSILKKNLND